MEAKKFKKLLLLLVAVLLLTGGVVLGMGITKKYLSSGEKTVVQKKVEVVDEESVVINVVEKATPSVVTVSINKDIVTGSSMDIFRQLFGFYDMGERQIENIQKDIGTGFIISSDGLIVTNKHVVSDTQAKYKVIIGKDETVEVIDIYRDPVNDLAILKVNKTGLTPVEMGDSDKLKVGQTVVAIGTALGEFRSTVTKGVISGLGRGITAGGFGVGMEKLEDVIQVDAAINPGNSGGPLFDSNAKVIGVNVAVSQSGQSIGFALPINLVKASVDNFRQTGEFDRPYLGVAYQMISERAALLNEVPMGAYVQTVMTDSPAAKAGLKAGDIIIEIDGKKLSSDETSIADIVNHRKIGDSLKLKYYRNDKETEVEVKLEKRVN
ncbi:MAG TPA: trypsin-like peptidase domain-containing protein [Candidatus Woesebacteria bacterium]|jgi:serine protease Do|nr:trypsin-like peptidase domain-containing protein [Candidatus Shapirobacteria bacterium]HOR02051.1 trypsin-like peptidase domain-containing protein [Candidatus Woesebacteria bacterium]